MQTALADFVRDTPEGREADQILRACVHCGFCTATCPTYQLLGDELDGPRGRIYQIKQVLEGAPASPGIRTHLDRCLTCLSCETTCPSGVRYGRLLEIGRHQLDRRTRRPWLERWQRHALRWVLPERRRFARLYRLGQWLRPLLPASLGDKLPESAGRSSRPRPHDHRRHMVLLEGCVQPVLAPEINDAAIRVLDRLGIRLEASDAAGCCGAVRLHLGDEAGARAQARANINAWEGAIEAGAEALVSGSSACALMLKDYGRLLVDDPAYAVRARRVSELARDLSEVVAAEDLEPLDDRGADGRPVAFHAPCTLQHGQQLNGAVERLLTGRGIRLTPVAEPHLCCGSAGTYSLLQPELSARLKARKLQALESGSPQLIATANIGCLAQLRQGAGVPVVHWIQLLDRRAEGPPCATEG
jgi:glycolate oxidase iron-sulfur subunit